MIVDPEALATFLSGRGWTVTDVQGKRLPVSFVAAQIAEKLNTGSIRAPGVEPQPDRTFGLTPLSEYFRSCSWRNPDGTCDHCDTPGSCQGPTR